MAEHYVAREPLYLGRARAASPGDTIPASTLRNHPEWQSKVTSGEKSAGQNEFDPGEHTVDEVTSHLAVADETETQRVLAAETDGKQRKSILEG